MAKSPETSSKSKPPAARKAPAAAPAPAVDAAGPALATLDRDADGQRFTGVIVFTHVVTTGKMGCLTHCPLHEVPLMRRKLEAMGQTCTIEQEWPKDRPRERGISNAYLAEEYARLQARYRFKANSGAEVDAMADIYGPAHNGRLIAVIRKMHLAYVAAVRKAGGDVNLRAEDLEKIAQLAMPEGDFIDADTAAE